MPPYADGSGYVDIPVADDGGVDAVGAFASKHSILPNHRGEWPDESANLAVVIHVAMLCVLTSHGASLSFAGLIQGDGDGLLLRLDHRPLLRA
jgi:hypothetical protein